MIVVCAWWLFPFFDVCRNLCIVVLSFCLLACAVRCYLLSHVACQVLFVVVRWCLSVFVGSCLLWCVASCWLLRVFVFDVCRC